ncbi:class I SAM-dependent methyltransferase [Microbacterium invictum]|uniref:O-methyltransferase YrrM n=1 Tax=Microbacterium invictum TaxID=515415 RepID=A0AA40VMS2_9MICO|nr:MULTISPECIES: class I SAM-dependent methyltransferase [Microbacterium]MBB4140132.1 putative O-methyltransferase YrrM [Microbacterium invictum]
MSGLTRRDWAVFTTLALLTVAVVMLALFAPPRWAIAGLGVLLGASAVIARAQLIARRDADQRLRRESRVTRDATKRTLQVTTRTLKQMTATRDAVLGAGEAMRAAAKSESMRTAAMRAELRGVRVSQQLSSQTMTALRGVVDEIDSQLGDTATKDDVAELARLSTTVARLGHVATGDNVAELAHMLETARASEVRSFTETLRPSINSLEREIRRQHPEIMTDFQSLQQLLHRFGPQATLPPIAGWAMSPSGLLALTDEITKRDAELVVECGSGSSTLWMALAMRAKGRGKVIALEHLQAYADKTTEILREHGVADWAEVRVAPLTSVATPQGEFQWYDIDATEWDRSIDLLLVDGPPTTTGKHARYPALPVFAPALKPSAQIVVDDAERQDEREVIELWQAEWPDLLRLSSPGRGVEVFGLVKSFA